MNADETEMKYVGSGVNVKPQPMVYPATPEITTGFKVKMGFALATGDDNRVAAARTTTGIKSDFIFLSPPSSFYYRNTAIVVDPR